MVFGMKVLFLDDARDAKATISSVFGYEKPYWPCDFTQVYNYDEFVKYIEKNGLPDWIFFDHDLGEGPTGHDAAKWLVEYCRKRNIDVPGWYIQSSNGPGKSNIDGTLRCYHKFWRENLKAEYLNG